MGEAAPQLSTMCRILLTTVGLTSLLGCNSTAPRHKFWLQIPAPAQQWIAAAETKQSGMLDSSETATSVYLFVPDGNSPPEEVITVFERGARPEQFAHLQMKWVDAEHLDVTYTDGQLSRQTVLYGDVTITLHGPEALQVQASPATSTSGPQQAMPPAAHP